MFAVELNQRSVRDSVLVNAAHPGLENFHKVPIRFQ